MKRLPIVIAYFLFPVINILTRDMNYAINRNWIDVAWMIMFFVSLLLAALNNRLKLQIKRPMLVFSLVIINWTFVHYFYNLAVNQTELVPLIQETKPFLYVLFVLFWLKIWGSPKGDYFIDGGVVLGLILTVEFVVESFLAHQYIRVSGSGEINYDAMLLVVSSCFLINQGKFWSQKSFWRWMVILLGLFISLSRTALATEMILWFMFMNICPVIKIAVIALSVVGVFLSFNVRDLSFVYISMDRYWMWTSALGMFLANPIQALLGFGIQPLPVTIPAQLMYLWIDLQQTAWGLSGIYAYNFHSFWLRFGISWGAIGIVLLVLLIVYLLVSYRQSKLVLYLIIVFTLEGLTMGTVYLSNVGIPFMLALAVGISNTRDNTARVQRA